MLTSHVLKYLTRSLVPAVLLSLLSLAPASAQSYGGNYSSGAMPHVLAVYTDSRAQQVIFRGQIITGPNASVTYRFTAPSQPGTYFFRCDVHPTIMMGQFVVQ
jgi:hypothetical protein